MEYKFYKCEDFLLDDLFVKSMLNPTKESEAFWKKLIDNEDINVDEFISAFMMLQEMRAIQPEVATSDLEALWCRIEKTNSSQIQKRRNIRFVKYIGYAAAVACVIIGAFVFQLQDEKQNSTQSISQFAQDNSLNIDPNQNKIQLVNAGKSISLNGNEANVKYDNKGSVVVNNKTIREQKATDAKSVYNQLYVPYGKRANLTLSDGTQLWINTGTRVIYPSAFDKDKREIFVDGEVFAEVTHDKTRPFIIKTTKLDVKVFGTAFNLSAYNDDKQVNVVLVNGSVGVTPKNGKTTYIKPNQLLSYNEQAMTLRNVDVENYISWRDGIYIFKNEPIEDILIKLSRYYNVTIKLPETASGITCSGKLELKDDLDDLLNGLTEITPMNYGVKDNVYRVSFQ